MTERHESSCSVHNAPAYEPGPCDCKYRELNYRERLQQLLLRNVRSKPYSPYFDPADFDEARDKAVEAIRMSDQ